MGPRAFARGNDLVCCLDVLEHIASMGQRAFARGNGAGCVDVGDVMDASMGPRAFARGNAERGTRIRSSMPGFNGAARVRARKYRCCYSLWERFEIPRLRPPGF